MDVCPVCEAPHPREALECSVCGHIFHAAAVDASIVPLDDLEPTRAADLSVGVEVTPGLEPTSFDTMATAGFPPAPPIEGLEPTLSAPQEVAVEATPDLEPTGLAEEEFPSIFAADVTCPNCGEVEQGDATFCSKCSMRLPRSGPAEPRPEAPPMTCTSCGGQSFSGGRCQRCGARQPAQP